mgnify:FL=1
MKNRNNTICFDIATKVIVDGKNIGYSDFDIRLDKKSILSKISRLEFTFGKVHFKNEVMVFKGVKGEDSAKIYMSKEDLSFIREAYAKQQPRMF